MKSDFRFVFSPCSGALSSTKADSSPDGNKAWPKVCWRAIAEQKMFDYSV